METLSPGLFLAALIAGAVSGGTGFGAGFIFALLLATGSSFLDSLAIVKLQAAVCDLAAVAAFAGTGQLKQGMAARTLVLGAAGAALGAATLAGVSSPAAMFVAGAIAVGAILTARTLFVSKARTKSGADAGAFALGAYLAVWGFGTGSVLTAQRMAQSGRSFVAAVADARAFGAAGNVAAFAVLACALPVAWSAALPVLAGHLLGTYGATRCLGRWEALRAARRLTAARRESV